jgi:hypothetical protein
MRRFTMPASSGELRPLATGALSIGLVLVLVGSVVPRSSEGPQTASAPVVVREAAPGEALATSAAQKVGEPPASEPAQADTLGGTEAMMMEAAPAGDAAASPDSAGLAASALDAAALAADTSAQDVAARSATRLPVGGASPAPALAPLADEQGSVEDGATVVDMTGDDERIDAGVDDESAIAAGETDANADTSTTGLDLGTILIVTGVALVAVGLILGLLLVLSRRHPDAARG